MSSSYKRRLFFVTLIISLSFTHVSSLSTNKRNDRKVNEFVGVLGAVAEVVPEVHDAIPEVTDIVKNISPLVGNLFKFLKK